MERQPPQETQQRKWSILIVVILSSFMAILDNNIVNVALPKIMANFGARVDQIEWVVTGFMIAFAISMPATSWLREVLGLKKVFMASLVLFCLGSALCGAAWGKDSLIAFRIIQAIGGGAMMPTGLTLISETFPPHERGTAMGVWSIGLMVGPAVGPFLGGYLVDEVSWRAIFYVNLPVGVMAILAAHLILPPSRPLGQKRRFDVIGFISFSVFLAGLLIALTQGQREGWNSDYILSCFGFSLLGLIPFVVSGFLRKDPIIDLRLFGIYNFLMANIINFVRAVAIFGSMFLLPLFLQNLMGYTALRTGFILAPTAISIAIVSPFSGIISDRIGARIPLFVGTVLTAFSLYIYKDLSLNSDYWFLLWSQVLRGVGMGLINAPLMSTALNAIRREQTSDASGLLTVNMQVGGAFGIAIIGATLERREFFHYAHYIQQIDNAFSPPVSRALSAMQESLLRAGHAPAEVVAKGQTLLALWVQKQAAVSAFGDAFLMAAIFITAGILPTLLIRNTRFPAKGGPVGPSE
ncbi:MAG: DHA2 family efflux MFS transporter permease subunit [Thermodesulfobacteriota bacterium]